MTKWLASVKSLSEVKALFPVLPDILDMKNPSQGALGALACEQVREIVAWVNQRCLTSATVGDLPMESEQISSAIIRMAAMGVDYVKIGLFDDAQLLSCIAALKETLDSLSTPVIAVMFADQIHVDFKNLLPLLKQSGFAGVMVDTATKNGQGLLDHWSTDQLQQFVAMARQQKMLCGLAGALKIEDIELLRELNADYLGFRSALCESRQRTASLQPALAKQIQLKLQNQAELAS